MRRPSGPPAILCALMLLVACGGYRPAKFADRPVVSSVTDTAPIPMPSVRQFTELAYLNDIYLRRPIVRALEFDRIPDALDVNATDEVPRSSWFSPVPIDDIRESYGAEGAPWPPFVVESDPTLSQMGGIRVRDARGNRYELHRDPKKLPATTTAVKAIASRLVRALGYRTPEVWILSLKKADLIARQEEGSGTGTIERFLESGPAADEAGGYRVSATRWPPGADVGHSDAFGTRSDDPNDSIAHEDRRTLRALRLVAAWLDLDRLSPENTKDVYVGNPGEGHLLHYVLGFEHALGATRLRGLKARSSPTGQVRGNMFVNFVTLGFAQKGGGRKLRSLGELNPTVDPTRFAPRYEPALRMRPEDAYWIAKRIAELPLDVIRWAVDEGRIPDRATAEELTDAILARRRAVVRWSFRRVTPLEPIRLELMRAELVLRDEAIHHRIESERTTKYVVRFLDDSGAVIAKSVRVRARGEEVAIPLLSALLSAVDYFVVEVTAVRKGVRSPRTFEAHLLPATQAWRVAGLAH